MLAMWMLLILWAPTVQSNHELKLVHIIFSHKFYAPIQLNISDNQDGFPETLNYRFFLEETDDMVNSAKMNMFNLGVFLRQKYDKFLGDIYFPEIMRMRTTQYILSMISGQLVNAGLWPPAELQKWNDELDWQPVVTDYVQVDRDTLLLGTMCPSFLHEEEYIYQIEMSTSFISIYNTLFNHISQYYKSIIKRPLDVSLLYSCLETKVDHNQTLPAWSKGIFPDGDMKNVTLLSYDLLSRTALQKQLNGGTLLKAIINDTLEHRASNNTKKLKFSMYSGEERNLIGVLQSMNLWTPHILSPAASLLFEIYSNSTTGEYTIKLIYYTGIDNTTIHLNLPGCEEFCPIDKFTKYLEPVLPIEDENILCYREPIGNNNAHDNGISFNCCIFLVVSINFISQL